MEAFKRDVTAESICPNVYLTTFRRMFLDIAGKIVATSPQVILKACLLQAGDACSVGAVEPPEDLGPSQFASGGCSGLT